MKTVPALRVVSTSDAAEQMEQLGVADLPAEIQLALTDIASVEGAAHDEPASHVVLGALGEVMPLSSPTRQDATLPSSYPSAMVDHHARVAVTVYTSQPAACDRTGGTRRQVPL